jgi:hypothetical protein
MPVSRLEARDLMSRGYEMEATVLSGVVRRQGDGSWTVGDRALGEILIALEGEEVAAVIAQVSGGHGKGHTCRVCGTEYEGNECPRCRQVRQRLRGHS